MEKYELSELACRYSKLKHNVLIVIFFPKTATPTATLAAAPFLNPDGSDYQMVLDGIGILEFANFDDAWTVFETISSDDYPLTSLRLYAFIIEDGVITHENT